MKARVKATDRIIEVMCVMNIEGVAVWEDISGISTTPSQYSSDELEFLDFPEMPTVSHTPDYWTRLKHQTAISAMQGILSNPNLAYKDISPETICNHVAERVKEIAHALVEKLKEEEKK